MKNSARSVLMLGGIVAAVAIILNIIDQDVGLGWHGRWLVIGVELLLFLGLLGYEFHDRWDGVLIDCRNKVSLSRLQITLWTVLILSAYATVVWIRLVGVDPMTLEEAKTCLADVEDLEEDAGALTDAEQIKLAEEHCPGDNLKIVFPEEAIVVMGISISSLAGSSLIKQSQQSGKPKLTDAQKNSRRALTAAEQKVADTKARLDKAKNESALLDKDLKDNIAQQEKKAAEIARQQAKVEDLEKQEAAGELEEGERLADAQAELKRLENELEEINNRKPLIEEDYIEAGKKSDTAQKEYDEAYSTLPGLETAVTGANTEAEAITAGALGINRSASKAKWSDMFQGEAVPFEKRIDIGKVQMFFFTLVAVAVYFGALYDLIDDETALKAWSGVDLPAFTASLNTLLVISHVGYLTLKGTSTLGSAQDQNEPETPPPSTPPDEG